MDLNEPSAPELADLVVAMVGSEWPTTEEERVAWARERGLPDGGDACTDLDERLPETRNFEAPGAVLQCGWHFFRDEFVGINLFWDEGAAAPGVVSAAAETLREQFSQRWEPVEELADEIQGFTALWQPQGKQIDLYWHAPRTLPDGAPITGCLQLHVDHHGRAMAQEQAARDETLHEIQNR